MGRLRNLGATLSTLSPMVSAHRDEQGHSPAAEPWRSWYSLKRWRDLRWRVLVRDGFTCQCGCGLIETKSSQLVADHIKPHRGDPRLFWDEDNVQTLRKPCHDSLKQRTEKGWQGRGGSNP